MTSHPAGDPFGLRDPSLDGPVVDTLGQAPGPERRASRSWRRLVEWSATSAPVALLLLAGFAFGPRGINLLSADALSLARPGRSGCSRGAGRVGRAERGRSPNGRPARVRRRLSRCRTDHACRLGRHRDGCARRDGVGRPGLLDADRGRRHLRCKLAHAADGQSPGTPDMRPRASSSSASCFRSWWVGSRWRGSARVPPWEPSPWWRKPPASRLRWPPPRGCC